mgnify:CR=1 FL=1
MANTEKRVELVFPEPDTATIRSMVRGVDVKALTITLQDLVSTFNKYRVDSIEVTIGAALEAGDVIKLFVKPKVEGGVTIKFKPKETA